MVKTMEICANCGKPVTTADYVQGTNVFSCSNCHGNATLVVSFDEYKKMMEKKK